MVHVTPGDAALARERATRIPPKLAGPFAIECPDCLSAPGQWCRAIYTLPPGTLLRDPHHARVNAHDRIIAARAKLDHS